MLNRCCRYSDLRLEIAIINCLASVFPHLFFHRWPLKFYMSNVFLWNTYELSVIDPGTTGCPEMECVEGIIHREQSVIITVDFSPTKVLFCFWSLTIVPIRTMTLVPPIIIPNLVLDATIQSRSNRKEITTVANGALSLVSHLSTVK